MRQDDSLDLQAGRKHDRDLHYERGKVTVLPFAEFCQELGMP